MAKVTTFMTHGELTMGIDEDYNLYVNGHRVVTEQPLRLTSWQRFGAVLTVMSAVAVAATAVAQFVVDHQAWFQASSP